MKKTNSKSFASILIALLIVLVVASLLFLKSKKENVFIKSIEKQLSFGPRYVGSEGHTKVKKYIADELALSEAVIEKQEWTDSSSGFGLTNIIARFNPEAKERLIVATHYDTDPKATKDLNNKTLPVPGASDGASGVAVLLEVAKNFEELAIKKDLGVDLVFFDAENFDPGNFTNWNPKGSTYFSENINSLYKTPPTKAIVVDMVCDKNLNFKKESSSLKANKEEVNKLWEIGQKIAPKSFLDQTTTEIKDDHTPLNKIGIPSILLIDLDYQYHNTTKDTIDKCSGDSLKTTYDTLREYLAVQ
jgi:hypothetical protein